MKGLIVLVMTAFLVACSSSPKDRIVGRWEAIPPSDHRSDHDDGMQMEFMKDGRVNFYVNGKVEMSGARYIMAGDGKSMVFEHPSEPSINIVIEELTPMSLVLVWGTETLQMKRL